MEAGQKKRRLMGEINVVPYIDVMLVLLIIFMITTPLLTTGVEVDLPQADANAIDPGDIEDGILTLTVDASGLYYLSPLGNPEEALDEETVRIRVSVALRNNPELPVFVRADKSVPSGDLVYAMVILQAAGAPKVGIMTEPPEEG